MTAAYIYQAVNLLVSVTLVPILLRYLGIEEYAVWMIFTVLAGITLQFQNTIQHVVVKEIAREHHLGGTRNAFLRAKLAYRRLAGFVVGPYLLFGVVYLHFIDVSNQSLIAWGIYIGAYSLSYYFTPNNVLLLGVGRVSSFSIINISTRLLYLLLVILSLEVGLSLIGLGLALLLSVVLGALLSVMSISNIGHRDYFTTSSFGSITLYALHTLSAFVLYNGSLLIGGYLFSRPTIATYGLALQVSTMITSFALTPTQVWLPRLIVAVSMNDRSLILREIFRTMFLSNIIFVLGYTAVALFGPTLLNILGATLSFPNSLIFGSTFIAFAVELNIAILVNFMLTKGSYTFVPVYVASVLCGVSIGTCLAWYLGNIVWLILVPIVFQTTIALPLVILKVRNAI